MGTERKNKNGSLLPKIFMIFFAALLIMAVAVRAEDNQTQDVSDDVQQRYNQALDIRYQHITCKVEFTQRQIGLLSPYVTDLNLTADGKALADSYTQLGVIKNSENKTAFDAYIESDLKGDFQKATQDLNAAKANFGKYNISNQTKSDIKDAFKDSKAQYASCVSDKEDKMGALVEKHMDKWVEREDKIAEHMRQKGLNTTEMDNARAEMKSKIDALKAALDSKNQTAIDAALADISSKGKNIWAKNEKAKFNAYMDNVDSQAKAHGQGPKMDAVRNKMNSISADGDYSAEDIAKMKNTLREASKELKNVSKEALKEKKEKDKQDKENNGNGKGGRR